MTDFPDLMPTELFHMLNKFFRGVFEFRIASSEETGVKRNPCISGLETF
jgi:hypothetical protein